MDRKWFTSNSMADCLEHCSRYWGNGEGCYGVVWREDNKCWIRNSNTSVSGLKESTDGTHSALIVSNTYEKIDTACPGTDLSTHTLNGVSGLGYTLHCNKVIGGYDTCWSGYPKPCWDAQHVDGVFIGFYHTKTLDECVRKCTDQSPLCKGVSWNPDYSIGFANCWPKTGSDDNAIATPPTKDGVIHSVVITSFDAVDNTCPTSNKYSTTNNNNFDIHCSQVNDGTNITQIHTQNITSCMDSCATTNACVGVVFDSTLQDGFKNCYLKNTTSTISNKASATYAALSGSNIPSSSSTSTPNNSTSSSSSSSNNSSSGSNAWIAGPVIGGVAGLAIVAGAAFWWNRRKGYKPAPTDKQEDSQPYNSPPYSPGVQPIGRMPVSEVDAGAARNELPAMTKYAHRTGQGEVYEAP